jgi:hypothetical protein
MHPAADGIMVWAERNPMKPAFTAIGAALLLGIGSYVIGYPLTVLDYVIILFAASILMWTYEQYDSHHRHS